MSLPPCYSQIHYLFIAATVGCVDSPDMFSSLSNIELRLFKPICECHVLFEDLWLKAPGIRDATVTSWSGC